MNLKIIAVLSCLLVCIGLIACVEMLQPDTGISMLSYEDLPDPEQQTRPPDITVPVQTVEPPAPNHPMSMHRETVPVSTEPREMIIDFEQKLGEDLVSSNLLHSILIPVLDDTPSNNELQRYVSSQAQISGNTMDLTAVKTEDGYLSSMLMSALSFQYCDVTFRVRTLDGEGLFPAIWMMPQSGAKFPEIDIYESIGSEPDRIYGVLHYQTEEMEDRQRDYFDLDVAPSDTHTIRFLWTEEELCWYLDGDPVFSTRAFVPKEPMYLIFNLAVGGNWPGDPAAETVFPAVFHVEVEDFHLHNIALR